MKTKGILIALILLVAGVAFLIVRYCVTSPHKGDISKTRIQLDMVSEKVRVAQQLRMLHKAHERAMRGQSPVYFANDPNGRPPETIILENTHNDLIHPEVPPNPTNPNRIMYRMIDLTSLYPPTGER